MRIVQVANFVTERSGGQRRTLLELGRRYAAAGHSCTLVVPGERLAFGSRSGVDTVTLPGVTVPTSGGYRTILRRRPLQRLLTGLGPDVVELSDKTTLSWLPGWARARGVPTVLLVHERHEEALAGSIPGWLPWREVVRAWTRRCASDSAAIVCPSRYAARQFDGVDTRIVHVPLGVDLATFVPPAAEPSSGDRIRVGYVGRLSPEKRPDLAVAAIAELTRRGVDAHLELIGDGPLRAELTLAATGLPVTFRGRIDDRAHLAAAIGGLRAVIAPSPVEAFGLAILESLACGTPVVVTDRGAAGELIETGTGAVVAPDGGAIAEGLLGLLHGDRKRQSAACRASAEQFPWERTVTAMLDTFAAVRAARPGRVAA